MILLYFQFLFIKWNGVVWRLRAATLIMRVPPRVFRPARFASQDRVLNRDERFYVFQIEIRSNNFIKNPIQISMLTVLKS